MDALREVLLMVSSGYPLLASMAFILLVPLSLPSFVLATAVALLSCERVMASLVDLGWVES